MTGIFPDSLPAKIIIMRLKKLVYSIALLLPFIGNAQVVENTQPQSGDPIAAMLDSLVSIRNVVRLSETNLQQPPVFSENDAVLSDAFIQERISKISTPIPLTYNYQVKNYISLYASQRAQLTSRVLGLSRLYFPYFEQMLDKYNLPVELKYLAIVESALNPTAVSSAGATGIWQFMYNTGKLYGLNINSYIDERRDVRLATDAACRYFQDMYAIYGDWLLVIASYNCGPGNVNRAIARAGGSKNFWEISRFLPAETRGYVPAFIGATYVMYYAKDYNITPTTPTFTYFDVDTVGVKNNISFRQLSQTLNIPFDVIAFLNPVYKRNMIPGEGNRLYLPTEKISLYLANEEGLYASSGTELQPSSFAIADDVGYVQVKQHVKVRKGENLYSFAKRNYCSAKQVKKWNHLRSNYLKAGQKLVVYTTIKQKPAPVETTTETAANDKTDSAKVNTAVKADTSANTETGAVTSESKTTQVNQTQSAASKCIIHLVQPGDTLWNIAKRYEGVTVELLKEVNNFTPQSTLKVGSKIKIPTVG